MIFLQNSFKKITGARIFINFLPYNWNYPLYRPVSKFQVFERFSSIKSFPIIMAQLHLAISKGSPISLIDLLIRKLRAAYKHSYFLSCIEKICRYFIGVPGSNIAYSNSICKGIELLFKGKLNGSTRSRSWRYRFGPLHTSTFLTNTREEQSRCVTRYGVFNIKLRIKLGSY